MFNARLSRRIRQRIIIGMSILSILGLVAYAATDTFHEGDGRFTGKIAVGRVYDSTIEVGADIEGAFVGLRAVATDTTGPIWGMWAEGDREDVKT